VYFSGKGFTISTRIQIEDMNMIPLPLLTIALCVALLIGPFRAYADIDDIKAAMKQEDYRSAVNELWKLSKDGNYEAKMALGSLLGMLDINDKKIAPIQEAAEKKIRGCPS